MKALGIDFGNTHTVLSVPLSTFCSASSVGPYSDFITFCKPPSSRTSLIRTRVRLEPDQASSSLTTPSEELLLKQDIIMPDAYRSVVHFFRSLLSSSTALDEIPTCIQPRPEFV